MARVRVLLVHVADTVTTFNDAVSSNIGVCEVELKLGILD